MQSSPMISGMPRRVFVFTVSTARGRSAGEVCRIEPTCLLTIEVIQIAAASIKLHHLADLLFEGHASEQIRDTFFGGQVGILVWQVGGVGHGLLTFLVEAVSFNYHLVFTTISCDSASRFRLSVRISLPWRDLGNKSRVSMRA